MHPQKNNNLNTENCDTEDGWMSVVGTLERRLWPILAYMIESFCPALRLNTGLTRTNSLSVAEKFNIYQLIV